jgi:1-acyl-sn-glycerol-3-phosphate acyltransferase
MNAARVALGLAGAALYVAWALLLRRHGASVGLHRWLCAALRVKVRRFGEPGPGRRLIVSNHVSWLDVLVLGAMEPMAFLAKRQVGADSRTRWLVDLQGAVYVNRERKRCIPEVNAEMARRMQAGVPVVLFAEGTTSDGTRLLAFRSSHFEAARQAEAFVQAVYLDYNALAGMASTRSERSLVAWYGDMPFMPSLWRVLKCGGVRCDVHYGEVIASDEERNRKALARRVEKATRALQACARRDCRK